MGLVDHVSLCSLLQVSFPFTSHTQSHPFTGRSSYRRGALEMTISVSEITHSAAVFLTSPEPSRADDTLFCGPVIASS